MEEDTPVMMVDMVSTVVIPAGGRQDESLPHSSPENFVYFRSKNRHFTCANVIFAPAVYPNNTNKFIQSHDDVLTE